MIKLIQLIQELGINIIPKFNSNKKLMDFLNSNSKYKNQFIDNYFKEFSKKWNNDRGWSETIQEWRINGIEMYDKFLCLGDDNDNNIFFSLNKIEINSARLNQRPLYIIQLGPNTIYCKYY